MIYITNNAGIHTDEPGLKVHYYQVTESIWIEQVQDAFAKGELTSLIGHQAVVDHIKKISGLDLEYRRMRSNYQNGDVVYGLKLTHRLFESGVHDYSVEFTEKSYKYFVLFFYKKNNYWMRYGVDNSE